MTDPKYSSTLGYVCIIIAALFFGSNFLPVKKFATGDGMFFQWVLCSAIFAVGVGVGAYQQHGWDEFHGVAMLGGALWATGNVLCVPVIQAIGLSLGLLIWGATNMITGWAQGRWGLFGTKADVLSDPTLNTVGVVLALVALAMYLFIKPVENENEDSKYETLFDSLDQQNDPINLPNQSGSTIAGLSPSATRTFGVGAAMVSGVFYGLNFTPPTWAADQRPPGCHMDTNPSNTTGCPDQDMLDYVFPHYTGIFLASTFYFLCYCAYMKNQPRIYPEIVLPGFVSGIMWAIANTGWFIANQALGFTVAFPLVTSGPGLVAALWGVFLLGEIKGVRNYLILTLAFCFTAGSGVCISLSKQ